jgi:hypothetical protein
VAAGQHSALTVKHHHTSSFGMFFIQAALSIVMFAEIPGSIACSLQDHPSVDLMLPAAHECTDCTAVAEDPRLARNRLNIYADLDSHNPALLIYN